MATFETPVRVHRIRVGVDLTKAWRFRSLRFFFVARKRHAKPTPLLRATSMQLQPTFLSDVPKEIVSLEGKVFGGLFFFGKFGMLYPYFDGYISDKHRTCNIDGFTCLIHDSKLRSFWEIDSISQKSCGVFAWIFPLKHACK